MFWEKSSWDDFFIIFIKPTNVLRMVASSKFIMATTEQPIVKQLPTLQ